MRALILITTLSIASNGQGLISADGAQWKHVAVGKPANGRKFDIYVKLPVGGTRALPELTVKTRGGPESLVRLDCKRRMVKANDEEWVKAPGGSLGGQLIKWACGKGALALSK